MRDGALPARAAVPAWGVALLLLLSVVPLLYPTVPPLVDLPNHMSRYAIGADYGSFAPFRHWYDFHWVWVGNLGVDLPVTFLARAIGVEPATKLVVLLIPLLFVVAMMCLSRLVHGRIAPTVPIAAMFAYNYAVNFGFINYVLAAALALLALAGWIALDRPGQQFVRAALFVPVSLLVWTAHTVGWGVLGLLVFGYELAVRTQRGPWRRALLGAGLACLPLCAPLVPMAVWFVRSLHAAPSDYAFRPKRKLDYLFLSLRNWSRPADIAFVGCALATIALGFARGFRIDRRLLWPALGILVAFAIMPDALLGSGFTDLRLIPYALALAVLAVAPVVRTRLVAVLSALAWAVSIARTGYVAATYAHLSNGYERQLQALRQLPEGATVFGAARVACFRDPYDDRLDHVQRLATVRRHAFTNSTWPPSASQTLSVRPEMLRGYVDYDSQRMEPPSCRAYRWTSLAGSVAQLTRGPFDYYWVLGFPPAEWPRQPWLVPIWKGEDGVLYRIRRPAANRAAAAFPTFRFSQS